MGKTWPNFIKALKRLADKEDQSQINFAHFVRTLKEFGGHLSKNE